MGLGKVLVGVVKVKVALFGMSRLGVFVEALLLVEMLDSAMATN